MQEGLYCQQDERRLKNVQVQTTQVETRVTVVDIRPNINNERRERQDSQDSQDSQERLRQFYQQTQKVLKRKHRKKKEKETKKNLQLVELKLAELKLAEQQEPEISPDINTTPQLQAYQVQPTKIQSYAIEQEEHPTYDALVEQKTKQEECRKHVHLSKEIGEQEEYHRPEDVIKKLEDKREEIKRSALNKEREDRKRSALNKEREERKRSALNKEREERQHREREEQQRREEEQESAEHDDVISISDFQESTDSEQTNCDLPTSTSKPFTPRFSSTLENLTSREQDTSFKNTNCSQSNIPSSIKEQEQDKEQSRKIKQRIQQIREKLSLITEEDKAYPELEETITETAIKLHDECLDVVNSRLANLLKKFEAAKENLSKFKEDQYDTGYLQEPINNNQATSSSNQYSFRS